MSLLAPLAILVALAWAVLMLRPRYLRYRTAKRLNAVAQQIIDEHLRLETEPE